MKKYTSKKVAPIQFELDGQTFVAAGPVPVLKMSELAARRGENGEMDATAVMASVSQTFLGLLGPVEYARFAAHVAEHGTDTEVLSAIMNDIEEQRAGVPLDQPSPSSTGTEPTPTTWKVISSSGEVREEPLTPQRLAQLREAVTRAAG